MAAPRSVQFIALRNLSRGTQQVRHLHMTGPATYASPVLTKERPGLNLPRDIASLRNECKKRNIDFSGNKQDLISRLTADEITSSRAFSTAVEQSKRPTAAEKTDSPSTTVRHFNTSRALKQVNDTSTIDFAYLPDFDPDNSIASSMMRVPILPDNMNPPRTGAHAPEAEVVVIKPEISAASPFSVVLPMADSHDGHANGTDFPSVTDFMSSSYAAVAKPVEKQAGVLKEVWNSMLDDVIGHSKKATPA